VVRHWPQTAEDWERAFTAIHRETPTPGGTPCRGVAADAAVLRTGMDRVVVVGAADSLHAGPIDHVPLIGAAMTTSARR
jgi:hypothetical protein